MSCYLACKLTSCLGTSDSHPCSLSGGSHPASLVAVKALRMEGCGKSNPTPLTLAPSLGHHSLSPPGRSHTQGEPSACSPLVTCGGKDRKWLLRSGGPNPFVWLPHQCRALSHPDIRTPAHGTLRGHGVGCSHRCGTGAVRPKAMVAGAGIGKNRCLLVPFVLMLLQLCPATSCLQPKPQPKAS